MKLFIDSEACRSGLACQACRGRDAIGENFRKQMEKHFAPPPEWECPKERGAKVWGWKQPSRGLGDTVAKLIKAVTLGKVPPCRKCNKRQAALNKLLPYGAG
jgi:hypothetical protein